MKLWMRAVALGIVAAGCQSQPKSSVQTASPSVLDVGPAPAPYQPSVYAVPPGTAPAGNVAPGYSPPVSEPAYVPPPAVDVTPVATSRKTYIVKQGDTLFHIAKVHYGDGKRWREIAEANPGVTPSTLRVGQKLVVPE